MSKFVFLTVMIVAILFFLKIVGIETGADWLLNNVGLNGGDLSQSNFFKTLALIYISAAGAGIIIGFFTKSTFEWAILAMAAVNFFFYFSTFTQITNYASGMPEFLYYPIYFIFGIFGFIYVWSLFEFIFNR